jgi:hypothetical protein
MAISIFEKQLLTEFAESYIAEFKKAIETKAIQRSTPTTAGFSSVANASGNLANSGEFTIASNTLNILANDYLYFIIYGRNKQNSPRSKPPIANIKQWLIDKGLTQLSPWAVVNAINKNGSSIYQQWKGQPSGVLEDIPLDKLLEDLQNGLGERYIQETTTKILKESNLEDLNFEV